MSNHTGDQADATTDAGTTATNVCPGCGEVHDDPVIEITRMALDTAALVEMSKREELPEDVRNALALSAFTITTLVEALRDTP